MTEPAAERTQDQTQDQLRGSVRFGTRIGIDPGKARIGVARSDPSGMLATPVETVRRGKGDLDRIGALVAEAEALEVVVGLPRSLRGGEGPAAAEVRRFADRLARQVAPVPVRLCDERLTTVSAESMLRSQGKRGRAQRAVVDQAAAVLILQHALDAERGTGAAPGELVRQGTPTDPDTGPGRSPDRSPDTGTQAGAAPSGRGDA